MRKREKSKLKTLGLICSLIVLILVFLVINIEMSYAEEEKTAYMIEPMEENIEVYQITKIDGEDFITQLVIDGTEELVNEIIISPFPEEKSYITEKKGVPFRTSTEVNMDNVICMIPYRAEVHVLGHIAPEWQIVKYDKQIGFVQEEVTSDLEPSKNFLQKVWEYILNHL